MKLETLLTVVFIVLLLAWSASCGVMQWNECRRLHPWWYCVGEK